MSNFKPTVEEAEQIKLITELKQLKKLKKMTLQQIADQTRENGEEVSLSTIKLVFSDEAKHKAVHHELIHIKKHHFENYDPVIVNELEANAG